MSDSLGRRSLARAAAGLALENDLSLPVLALFTDEDRLPDPVGAAKKMPFGSLVVARARDRKKRERLVEGLLPVAKSRNLILLVADDAVLAARADGLHLPEVRAAEAGHWRARSPHWLITASAHSPRTFLRSDADAFFISPLFATKSHPDRAALTKLRAAAFARLTVKPVYALGGITARNASALHGLGFAGIAAVAALA